MPPTRTAGDGLHRLVRRAVDAAGHRPEANKATSVRVINGTKISGHAASRAYTLKQAGYKNCRLLPTPPVRCPASTVVWYQNETDAATAKDIAVTLGISDVRQMSGISAPVVVVLMQ